MNMRECDVNYKFTNSQYTTYIYMFVYTYICIDFSSLFVSIGITYTIYYTRKHKSKNPEREIKLNFKFSIHFVSIEKKECVTVGLIKKNKNNRLPSATDEQNITGDRCLKFLCIKL